MRSLLVFCAAVALHAQSGINQAQLAKIPGRMKSFVEKGEVAGTVTLVAHNGKIEEFDAVGYADIESKRPMTKDSIFQIMSMTKPMVATAIMMLAEEGKLALVDPVEKHLPEFRGLMVRQGDVLVKPARLITIRDLMTHTSGMVSALPAGIAELHQKMDRPLAEAVLIYSQQPLLYQPGTEWRYSNPGIAILGRIIEVTSGMPFEKFMAGRLWGPLGMKDTFIFPDAHSDKKARICAVQATKNGKLVHADGTILGGDALQYRKGAIYSAPEFGAYSTAQDLFSFYEMTRNWGVHKGTRILSRASIEVMTAYHTADVKAGHMPGTGFGLAWEVVKENFGTQNFLSVGTYGHGGAFGTHGWIDRMHNIVGVYLVQGGSGVTDAKYAFMRMATAAVE